MPAETRGKSEICIKDGVCTRHAPSFILRGIPGAAGAQQFAAQRAVGMAVSWASSMAGLEMPRASVRFSFRPSFSRSPKPEMSSRWKRMKFRPPYCS